MPESFDLEIATPERLLVREPVSEAQVPLANGYIGILPGHTPLLGELGTGTLSYVAGGRRREMVVSGGWAEVGPGYVRVLADVAENVDEIDVDRAEAERKRALDQLSRPAADMDVARALHSLRKAQARLEAAKR